MSDSQRRPGRRTVIKGAAWTVPAIVVATAAPAMDATGPASLSVAATQALTVISHPDAVSVIATITNTNTMPSTALAVRLTLALGNTNQASLPTASAVGYTSATVVGVPAQPLNPTT